MLPLVLLFLFATVLSVDEEVLLLCGVGAAVVAVAVVCRYEKRNHFHWQLVRSFCWLLAARSSERTNEATISRSFCHRIFCFYYFFIFGVGLTELMNGEL